MRPSYHIKAEDMKQVEPNVDADIMIIYTVLHVLNAIKITHELKNLPLFHDLRQRLSIQYIMLLRPDIRGLLQKTYDRFYKI